MAPPEDSGSGRTENFVRRERVEVALDFGEIDRDVGHRLGAIDESQCSYGPRPTTQVGDGQHRAECVRDVGHGCDFRARREPRFESGGFDLTPLVDRDDLEHSPRLLAEKLPRHDVRMVLELGNENFVTRFQVRAAPTLRHEIDRFGRSAGEDDLVGVLCSE